MAKNYYTSIEAAKRLGLSVGSIQKLVDKGTLASWKTDGGHRRIAYDSVESYASPLNSPIVKKQCPSFAVFLDATDSALRDLVEQTVKNFDINASFSVVSNPYIAMLEVANTKPDLFILDMSSHGEQELKLVIEALDNHLAFGTSAVISLTDSDEATDKFNSQLKGKALMFKKPFCQKTFYGYLLAKFPNRL